MSTSSSPSRVLRALRAASPALWPARLRLASLKAAYKADNYTGHPEEMLDAIDGVEYKIRDRVNGKRPVKAVPAPVVEPAPAEPVRTAQEQREYEELTARCHVKGGPFEPGLEAAERRLAFMQNLYRHGGFMGHPEDLLEDIETEQRHIKRLTAEALAKAF
ncbi:hypothetical protein [Pseudarthrobacter sp. BIM B-2242]|uniref:hypothetical protein n=1 Tax=Pseudarthrobacter sp. BIM B-2242 TaxID=2772401 RepID=UPI00168BD735|nr:hypothetical protein [Pseudarthrobacter sp. BIM B-2242]QOD06149.1 hypothetical protein IDT60_21560 [Pseudarthrobacter sp. BIM B-2242]